MNVYNVKADQLIFTGDLHGNFDVLFFWLKNFAFKNTTLIVCGDIGFGFNKTEYYKQALKRINNFCVNSNSHIFFFRGNHDDPSYFNEDKLGFENIKTIPDYSIVQVETHEGIIHNVLCVGGGVSVDRTWRIKQDILNAGKYARFTGLTLKEAEKKLEHSYWEDELPSYNEAMLNEITDSGIKIDIMASHTCPSFVGFKDKDGVQGWLNNDPYLEKDMNFEREVMDMISSKLKEEEHPLTNWVYGHFHQHMDEEIEGVRYTMLDMCRPEKSRLDTLEIRNGEMEDIFD